MIWKGWIAALGLFVIALAWVGCETPGMNTPYVCVDDEIRIGDTLLISILDVPESDRLQDKEFTVRNDGAVNLPRLNMLVMKADGKKFAVFEREIQAAYITNHIYRQVTVSVKPGSRFYTVAGEVTSHGVKLNYTGPTTLLRAIAAAGDFTEFANRRRVEITRANGQREVVDCKKAIRDAKLDRPICPGDYIFIPRSL
jgi:protein involved in polysaccharide export with SLBB domain